MTKFGTPLTRLVGLGVGAVALVASAAASPASAATTTTAGTATSGTTAVTTAPVSRIYSAAQKTCLDVSTTGGEFLDTYGRPCTGSTAQAFAFQAAPGAPAGTYEIISRATGQCMDQSRFAIRQEPCTTSAGAVQSNAEWTFQRVGTSGYSYRILLPATVGTVSPRCVTVTPQPNGYPGPWFTLAACTGAANQVLTLTTAP